MNQKIKRKEYYNAIAKDQKVSPATVRDWASLYGDFPEIDDMHLTASIKHVDKWCQKTKRGKYISTTSDQIKQAMTDSDFETIITDLITGFCKNNFDKSKIMSWSGVDYHKQITFRDVMGKPNHFTSLRDKLKKEGFDVLRPHSKDVPLIALPLGGNLNSDSTLIKKSELKEFYNFDDRLTELDTNQNEIVYSSKLLKGLHMLSIRDIRDLFNSFLDQGKNIIDYSQLNLNYDKPVLLVKHNVLSYNPIDQKVKLNKFGQVADYSVDKVEREVSEELKQVEDEYKDQPIKVNLNLCRANPNNQYISLDIRQAAQITFVFRKSTEQGEVVATEGNPHKGILDQAVRADLVERNGIVYKLKNMNLV